MPGQLVSVAYHQRILLTEINTRQPILSSWDTQSLYKIKGHTENSVDLPRLPNHSQDLNSGLWVKFM